MTLTRPNSIWLRLGLTSLDVSLWVAEAGFTGATDSGSLYAERAKAAGINITVERAPNDGYWSNVWMQKPWVASYWGGRATCDWMFSTAYAAGAPWNESYWDNERFNTLLLQGSIRTGRQPYAGEIYHEMQAIVSNEGGVGDPDVRKLCHGRFQRGRDARCRRRELGS
jgi:peptide/nickel transport system substrate-binding protein